MKYKGLIIITGVGAREAKRFFKNTSRADYIKYKKKLYKSNSAASAAIMLNSKGYIVYLIGVTEEKLKIVTSKLINPFYFSTMDLQNENKVRELKKEIEKIKKEYKIDVHVIHYGSASDTTIPLPNNSVFLGPLESPPKAASDLIAGNVVPWLNIVQIFLPIFNKQKKTKMITLTAVAAIRALSTATLDNIQKGAVHAMARSLLLDLTKENIYVTEVLAGYTDTGYYDDDFTLDRSLLQHKEYNYHYSREDFPVFSSKRVAEAITYVLETDAHVREISLIPYGQYPHLGA